MSEHAEQRDLVIEADRIEHQYWRDVWHYRELFYFLAWRNLVVRYKQTAIGISWALIRPFLSVVVFTVVFGKLAKLSSSGVPYPVIVAAGTLPWQLFASGFSDAASSLTNNPALVSKVYFPRVILPGSACITNLIDFGIGFLCTIVLMLGYGVVPSVRVLLLPFFTLLALACAVGLGLWLAGLNSRYQDVRVIVPFIAQIGLYFSPVGFSATIVPERFRLLYALNPLVGIIEGFRWALIPEFPPPAASSIASSVLVALVLVFTGITFFRSVERTLADVI